MGKDPAPTKPECASYEHFYKSYLYDALYPNKQQNIELSNNLSAEYNSIVPNTHIMYSLTDIHQIAAVSVPNLARFGVLGKPDGTAMSGVGRASSSPSATKWRIFCHRCGSGHVKRINEICGV